MRECQESLPMKEKIGTVINESSTGIRTLDKIENFEKKLQEFDERIKQLNQIAQNIRREAQQYKEVQKESFECFKKLIDEKVSSILSDPERFLQDNRNFGSEPSQGANNMFRILKTMKNSIVEEANLSSSVIMEKVCLKNKLNTEETPLDAEHTLVAGQCTEDKPQEPLIEAQSVPESPILTQASPTILTDNRISELEKPDSNDDVDEKSEKETYDCPIEQTIRGKWKLLSEESTNIEEFLCFARTNNFKHEVHYKDLKFLLNNDRLSTFSGENDRWTIQDHKENRKNSDGETKCYYIENNCLRTIHKHRGVAVEKTSRYVENDELIVETWLERNKEKGLTCVRRFKRMQ